MYAQDDILRYLERLPARDALVCLATVIAKRGSAYAEVGRRMLVDSGGRSLGALSGGCIETELQKAAVAAIVDQKPRVISFDTTDPADIYFGFNMGCNGAIDVLLQPLVLRGGPEDQDAAALTRLLGGREAKRIVSIVTEDGSLSQLSLLSIHSAPRPSSHVFAALPVDSEGVDEDLLADRESGIVHRLDCDGRSVMAFEERVAPPMKLKVYGASPGAGYLWRLSRQLGMECEIFDYRQQFREQLKDEFGIEVVEVAPSHIGALVEERDAWIIMSHNFECDLKVCAVLSEPAYRDKPFYVGLLGSRGKSSELRRHALDAGVSLPLAKMYAPIGLDLGGRTPQDIALSVVSEVKAVWHGKDVAHLRDATASTVAPKARIAASGVLHGIEVSHDGL